MALPKLNSTPKYEMNIPSTGETVRFRPFLIKEEKSMLIAAESGDNRTILLSLLDTLKACCDAEINENKLSTFDVEYMFLKLRAKSVGETTKIGVKCNNCGHTNTLDVNIEEIEIKKPETEKLVQLTDKIQVELDYPTFSDVLNSDLGIKSTASEQLFSMMNFVFKTVITDDERINLKEVSKEELTDFIESMDSRQFSKVKDFIQEIPKLRHSYDIECGGCKENIKGDMEGLANFLS
tara:strand:- start:2987 stop:3697 length:711 start_codon:yes stop_codon:yes gene_type:complete